MGIYVREQRSGNSTLNPTLGSSKNSTRAADGTEKQNEILEILLKCFDIIWAYLETLPLPPEATLAIAGGVFFIIIVCLCCCCCRFCCRKKEEKKKAKEKLELQHYRLFGSDYYERVQPKSDELDFNFGGSLMDENTGIKLGKIRFTLEFDGDENIASVTVKQATDIPAADASGFSDPFVKVSLVPAGKKQYKTKVVKETLNPVYNQTFQFKNITYAGLMSSNLFLRLYDYDKFSSDLLGETKIPVVDLDLTKEVDEWRILSPEFKAETKGFTRHSPKLGHICIAVAYSQNDSLLVVFVLGCKDLEAKDEGGFSDPYVTFWLIQEGRKLKRRKTTVKLRTINPSYNETFPFRVPSDKIEETSLMFVVADYDKGEKGDPIGEVIIGQLASGQQFKHWKKMQRNPGKPVAMWHRLRPPTVPDE